MDIHNVRDPTNREELKELNTLLRKYTDRIHPLEGKKMRAKMKRKIKYDGFTDLDLVWESLQSPPPEPEPEEEPPQEDS